MINLKGSLGRSGVFVLALSLVGVACGDDDDDAASGEGDDTTAGTSQTIPVGHNTGAADARSSLNGLLAEHVFLAGAATNAILGALPDVQGAAAALDANSVALSKVIGGVFGAEAEEAFLPLWRKHIDFVVQYTQGKLAGEVAAQDTAVSSLLAYTQDFGAFINSALPKLETKAVADLVATHVETLKGVIDAQAAKDWPKAFVALRTAAAHMSGIAETLATEIAALKPKDVPGDAKSPASTLRTQIDGQLREHVFLAAAATGAALGDRPEEFEAAAAALDGNSEALTASVASVYGAKAGEAFAPLWKSHITMVVDYTTGRASGDGGKAAQAAADLAAYAGVFGTTINSLSPELPADTVTELVATHIATLKAVIDAQAGNDPATAYTTLREAAAHMDKIAEPLTGAIVEQFSDLFPGA